MSSLAFALLIILGPSVAYIVIATIVVETREWLDERSWNREMREVEIHANKGVWF